MVSEHTDSIILQPALKIKNRYIVNDLEKDKLGEGGIGVVYKAMDKQENKFVAVKILHSLITHDPWIKDKFDKEAQAIIRIKHEGVVAGIEADKLDDGRPYLVMDYIQGESLRKPIEKSSNGMDLARSANILKKFGEALTAIHNSGVYHRDLKPENIMLTFENGEEKVKVIDFGIATVKESPDERTKTTAQLAGTASYMAPEQIIEGKISAKSDIYTMGVIAYEMVTRRQPFYISERSISAYLKFYELQQEGVKVRPKQLRPEISQEADYLILQALEFEPSKRPITAEDFGNKLYEAINKNPVEPVFITTPKPEVVKPKATKLQIFFPSKNYFILLIILVIGMIVVIGKVYLPNNGVIPTPTNTLTPNLTKFSYFVELAEFRDGKYQEAFPITGVTIVAHNKDRILFNVCSEREGYVYLLNESAKPLDNNSPRYNVLFPAEKEINHLLANKEIKLPGKDQAMEITDIKGTEKYWIVWSKQEILGLESLRTLLNRKDKGVVQNLNQIDNIKKLLEKYSNNKLITIVEDKKAKKMLASSTENIIVVCIELEHK